MRKTRLLLVVALLAVVVAFFLFDLDRFLTLDFLKAQQVNIAEYRAAHPWLTALFYFAVYVFVAALSLPGAAIMTLLGGAVFGTALGSILAVTAATVGATLCFLLARFLLRDGVQSRFSGPLAIIDAGIQREGAFYLFAMRLTPVLPFFVINPVMGLTRMGTASFAGVSLVGMLPASAVLANAGKQLANLSSPSDVLSPALIGSLMMLGLLPLIAKRLVEYLRMRKALARFPKPAHFDRNLIVIGAGSAGLVTSYIAAAVKASVTLIEKHRMGGDCLNTGCVPSKALIRTARFIAEVRRARDFGCKEASVEFDFPEVMRRVHDIIRRIEPHDSVDRYRALGVDCIEGEARIVSPYAVEVNGKRLTTRAIIVATGARPLVPPIPGIEAIGYLTSDTIWSLRSLPRRLVVLGGGPIGCELAQCFARLGSMVTLVEMAPRLLSREDPEVSALIESTFRREGITVMTGNRANAFQHAGESRQLLCNNDHNETRIEFDAVLVAVGRVPSTRGLGLEELGVTLAPQGSIAVNRFLQTNFPNIYACGDVAGPFQFTHTASHQAWYAAVNALFGGLRRFKVDYSVIPWATFTEPEVARVGLNESEARDRDIPYEVTTYGIDDLDRAIADSAAQGWVKVLTVPGKDRILGVTIVGEHAGDLIAEYILAMRHRLGLNRILSTIHIYPTMAEANRHAAGAWKRSHAPQTVLRWLERYHAWRRRQRTPHSTTTE